MVFLETWIFSATICLVPIFVFISYRTVYQRISSFFGGGNGGARGGGNPLLPTNQEIFKKYTPAVPFLTIRFQIFSQFAVKAAYTQPIHLIFGVIKDADHIYYCGKK